MQCINSRAIKTAAACALAAAIGAATVAGSIAAEPNGNRNVLVIDDAIVGKAMLGRFDYIGSWQHVHGKHDGRTNGTSTRSTHTGDVAILSFTGTRIRVFGIRGPSGGRAGVALDEASTGGRPVDFYAAKQQTHALIYQSPVLPSGVHTLSIVVWGTRNEHGHYYYVNIDGAEVES